MSARRAPTRRPRGVGPGHGAHGKADQPPRIVVVLACAAVVLISITGAALVGSALQGRIAPPGFPVIALLTSIASASVFLTLRALVGTPGALHGFILAAIWLGAVLLLGAPIAAKAKLAGEAMLAGGLAFQLALLRAASRRPRLDDWGSPAVPQPKAPPGLDRMAAYAFSAIVAIWFFSGLFVLIAGRDQSRAPGDVAEILEIFALVGVAVPVPYAILAARTFWPRRGADPKDETGPVG